MKQRLVASLAARAPAALVLLVACADPTEVVVFADTELGVPCQVDRLRITVTGDGAPVVRETDAREPLPSVTVLSDGGGAAFQVQVEALKAGAVVASATANGVFVEGTRRVLPMVVGRDCRSAPCDLTAAAADFAQPTPPARASCEGVSSRYRVSASTLVSGEDACVFPAVTAPTDVLGRITDQEVAVDEEGLVQHIADRFDFRFYGERIQKVWVSGDGYVTFGAAAPQALTTQVSNLDIATSGAPRFGVSAFWDRLDFKATGKVCVGVQTAGDIDTLWVTWKNACFSATPACNAADDLTFSVGLEEKTNRVIVHFENMQASDDAQARGARAVLGILAPGGKRCDIGQCDLREGLCSDGVTPCGYTQVFAREAQPAASWPATYVFEPVPEL